MNIEEGQVSMMCHQNGCVFSLGHRIKHSFEYTDAHIKRIKPFIGLSKHI